jgi:hypothetical protein
MAYQYPITVSSLKDDILFYEILALTQKRIPPRAGQFDPEDWVGLAGFPFPSLPIVLIIQGVLKISLQLWTLMKIYSEDTHFELWIM